MIGKVARGHGISSVEECAGLVELTGTQERILIDCFRAIDTGSSAEECFDRYPQRAESLRGYVDLRSQLLAHRATDPSPVVFASGREALLARVIRPLANGHPGSAGPQAHLARGPFWRPAARVGVAGALLFAMAGCALGVSATAGGDRLSNVLPPIPTMRAPYPFPMNDAPNALPTADLQQPSDGSSDGTAPAATAEPPADAQDTGGGTPTNSEPSRTDPAASWLPPQTAHEDGDPGDVITPAQSPGEIATPTSSRGSDHETKPDGGETKKNDDGSTDGPHVIDPVAPNHGAGGD